MANLSEEEDEELKLAIALSLQEEDEISRTASATAPILISDSEDETTIPGRLIEPYAKASKTQDSASTTTSTGTSSIRGLDRKAMEEERLTRIRKRKASPISPPLTTKDRAHKHARLESSKEIKHDNQKYIPGGSSSNATTPHSRLPFSRGVVRKTWVFGFPRENDIKLEEVLDRQHLSLAVLSSFQWDIEWLLRKVDTSSTKLILVMQAKDEATKIQYRQETASMPFLRLCFPSMVGNVNCMHSKLMLLSFPSHLRVVVPTANLTSYDWGENGVIENTVFLIDLPRLPDGKEPAPDEMTTFAQDLIYFCTAKGLEDSVVQSLHKFDFSATTDLAFVHSIGGAHSYSNGRWKRTGYCGLGRAITGLGLSTVHGICIDFVASSVGSLNDGFMTMLYLACQGDDGMTEYNARGRRSKKDQKSTLSESSTSASRALSGVKVENIRVYFPSHETVLESRGGEAAAGPVCFQRKFWESPQFPRYALRDCKSVRQGLLMHNKVLLVQPERKPETRSSARAWAYVGSANCSESAWGRLVQAKESKEPKLNCRNWECGVVLPVAAESEPATGRTLDVFRSTIPIPIKYPGDDMAQKKPWFFLESTSLRR